MRAWLLAALTERGLWLPLASLGLAAILVYLVAGRLARHADTIADVSGLGHAWVGSLLLAASTSLPELITALNAGALDVIDIGIGDLFGASLSNMLLLAVLDLAAGKRGVLARAAPEQAFVGAVAILMLATAGGAMASGGWGRAGPVGVESLVLVALYVGAMRAARIVLKPTAPPDQLEFGENRRTLLLRALRGFGVAAVGLLAAAPLVVISAEAAALEAGLSESFVGTLLVGLTTSLPEIVATITAVRLGAIDLAVGNIFGSIAFNLVILAPMDLVSPGAPLLARASPEHVKSALFAIITVALGLIGMLAARGSERPALRVESVLVVLAWVGAMWLLL